MFKKILTISLCFVLLLLPLSVYNAKAESKNYEKTIATARTEIWKALTAGGASSATVAIMDDGKIVYEEGFAMANRVNALAVKPDTQFNIGSVSKVFTAAAVMQLVQEGKLELDKKVIDYLPEFTMKDERYKDITVRMLLNHSSGMPGTYTYNGFATAEDPSFLEAFMSYLATSTLKEDPGKVSVYCNDGFMLAEVLIEKVSGQSYSDYLEKNVFATAGMDNTSCYFKEGNTNVALKYSSDSGMALPKEYINLMGTGGISATAVDLCKFSDALLNNKIMNEGSFTEYISPQYASETVPSGIPITNYGLGWDMVEVADFSKQGVQVISKNGGTLQYNSMLYMIPEGKLSVAVIFAGTADTTDISNKITQALLKEKGMLKGDENPGIASPENAPMPEELLGFSGYYGASGSIMKVELDQENGVLVHKAFNNGAFETVGTYPYKNDGNFYMPTGNRLSLEENFGKKFMVLHFPATENGIVIGENIEGLGNAVDPGNFTDKQWIPINLKAMDLVVLAGKTGVISELPGTIYLGAEGNNTLYQLKDANTSEMILPYARDLMDLQITPENGKNVLKASGYALMNVADVAPIQMEERISITRENQNESRRLDNDGFFKSSIPEGGRIVILSPDLSVSYDSLINEPQGAQVNSGSYVIFVGNEGDSFEFEYTV